VLGVASVVACACSVSGSLIQDLKAGHLLGGTPWKMQVVEIVRDRALAVSDVPHHVALHEANLATGGIGGRALPAPQAGLMAQLAKGIVGGQMAWGLIAIGAAFGIALIMCGARSPMLVAVGMYLPFDTVSAIFVGGIVPYYDDYRKMLDEVKPDIVWAFVENNRHLEIVQECAPRKIQVIFEKPLAATLQDALAIERLAAENGIRVMTNYQMVWWPANYAAKAEADRGAIGQVWRLHGTVGHGGPASEGPRNRYFFAWLTDPVANGAGSLVDFGCYNALWSLWYLGRPETVYATVTHLRPGRFPGWKTTPTWCFLTTTASVFSRRVGTCREASRNSKCSAWVAASTCAKGRPSCVSQASRRRIFRFSRSNPAAPTRWPTWPAG
jgi:predicted dehydrogenase